MTSLSRGFATTAIAAALCSTLAAQTAQPTATAAQTTGNVQSGKELYLKYGCYACHGYDGHGGAGARLVPMRMALQGFSNYVHNPRQMPPYTTRVLSDAQLMDLFAYVKSLPESPPSKDISLLMRIINEAQIQKK